MSNDWLVLFFISLGTLPGAIIIVFVMKQENLFKKSIYLISASVFFVSIAAGSAHLFGDCNFFEAITMRKRCGTTLLPPKSISIFYGLMIFGLMILLLSIIRKLLSK